MPFDLKRSNSDPNIKIDEAASLVDEANMATAADKKRSKLGYHRASTACSKTSPKNPSLSREHNPWAAGPVDPNRCLNSMLSTPEDSVPARVTRPAQMQDL